MENQLSCPISVLQSLGFCLYSEKTLTEFSNLCLQVGLSKPSKAKLYLFKGLPSPKHRSIVHLLKFIPAEDVKGIYLLFYHCL